VTFLAILAALALEQWRAPPLRQDLVRAFLRWAGWLERRFNAGEARHGAVALVLAVGVPVALVEGIALLLYQLSPVLAAAWSVVVLYLSVGFRGFSHAFTEIAEALREGDVPRARRALTGWRGASGLELGSGEIARLAIEQGVVDAHRNIFGPLLWFLVLPGPGGALLYRCTQLVAARWRPPEEPTPAQQFAEFGRPARALAWLLDWVPVRLTAASFAVAGDFEDAIFCWRTQAASWHDPEIGILLASAAGALGIRLGEPLRDATGTLLFRPELGMERPADADAMSSALGLGWRALILWLALVLLITLAYWVG
jgi:adenosylcobinamide-phosphate synthase